MGISGGLATHPRKARIGFRFGCKPAENQTQGPSTSGFGTPRTNGGFLGPAFSRAPPHQRKHLPDGTRKRAGALLSSVRPGCKWFTEFPKRSREHPNNTRKLRLPGLTIPGFANPRLTAWTTRMSRHSALWDWPMLKPGEVIPSRSIRRFRHPAGKKALASPRSRAVLAPSIPNGKRPTGSGS